MISRRIVAALAAGLSLGAAPALANDSTAMIGVGGLQLTYTSAIEIVREDLYVSDTEVRVRYVFRNITEEPVTTTVAFPLPPLDGLDLLEGYVDVADVDDDNYVNFRVWLNDKELQPSVYNRVSALGIDRTELFASTGLPLSPISYQGAEMIGSLPQETLDEMERAGLIAQEEWGTLALWTLETTFYWEQTFPVGRDIIVEHSYRPVVGYSFFGDYQLDDAGYIDRYCMDEGFISAAERMLAAGDPQFGMVDERRVEYILTTGNNWAAPIGTFHLTVDKGKEAALVSFCGSGVTKTGPTTFELTETNFYPDRELDILIIDPIDQ